MNKRIVIPLIILDLILIAAAGLAMTRRYYALTIPANETPQPLAADPVPASAADVSSSTETPSIAVQGKPRNIGFVLYNSGARRVVIMGDFTSWKNIPMRRGKGGKWAINYLLTPGTYAYNFIIDNKIVIDRNNPRTRNSGRGFLSSSLTVEPLLHETQPTQ